MAPETASTDTLFSIRAKEASHVLSAPGKPYCGVRQSRFETANVSRLKSRRKLPISSTEKRGFIMSTAKVRVPGSSRQDNLPMIKVGMVIMGLMLMGFVFLILQIVGMS